MTVVWVGSATKKIISMCLLLFLTDFMYECTNSSGKSL